MFNNKFKEYELLAPIIVLILLCVFIGLINNNFFSFRNFVRIANGASIPLILGIGVTFIIIMGSIDLSIEGVVAFSAVTLSLIVLNGHNENNLGYYVFTDSRFFSMKLMEDARRWNIKLVSTIKSKTFKII